jgi:F0F1-type ATP synthase assembly protein I
MNQQLLIYVFLGLGVVCFLLSVVLFTISIFRLETARSIGARKQETCGREYMEAETIRYEVHQAFASKKVYDLMMASFLLGFISIILLIIGYGIQGWFSYAQTSDKKYQQLKWFVLSGTVIWVPIYVSFLSKSQELLFSSKITQSFGADTFDNSDQKEVYSLLGATVGLSVFYAMAYVGLQIFAKQKPDMGMIFFSIVIPIYLIIWAAMYIKIKRTLNRYTSGVNDLKIFTESVINEHKKTTRDRSQILLQMYDSILRTAHQTNPNIHDLTNSNTDFKYIEHRIYENKENNKQIKDLEIALSKAKTYDEDIKEALTSLRKFGIALGFMVFGIPMYMILHMFYHANPNMMIMMMTIGLILAVFVITIYGWFMGALVL